MAIHNPKPKLNPTDYNAYISNLGALTHTSTHTQDTNVWFLCEQYYFVISLIMLHILFMSIWYRT